MCQAILQQKPWSHDILGSFCIFFCTPESKPYPSPSHNNSWRMIHYPGWFLLSERKSILLCLPALVCCLVKPPTGPGQRVTIPRHPDRDALRAGPPTTSRHYGVGPSEGESTAVGAMIRVTEPPPYRSALGHSRSRRARMVGTGVDDFWQWSTPTNPVTWLPLYCSWQAHW